MKETDNGHELVDAIKARANEVRDADYARLREISSVVSVKSFDSLNLKAYLARNPEESHCYLVTMHGYRSSPKAVSNIPVHFYSKGWNVLVPGQRGHGWSDGNFVDMGAFACRDVLSWIGYINSIDKKARIVISGVSMGAATVMLATGLELPENVVCCIEDCGYTSVFAEFNHKILSEYHLVGFPIVNIASAISRMRYGFSFDVSPKRAVASSKIPTLFIHGSGDDYVPYYMLDELYEAASCEKEKLVIEGADHAIAGFVDPVLYWNTVDAFVEKHLH